MGGGLYGGRLGGFHVGSFSSRLGLFLPGGKFFFQPVTLASDLGLFHLYLSFSGLEITYLMVLCCDMRSLCLPSIPPASYRVCGCLAIGDSYEKSYITKINNLVISKPLKLR